MHTASNHAYLLHAKAFQEHKVLLDLLVEGVGRIRAVARKPAKKQNRQQYPLFCRCWLQYSGHGELKTVQRLEEQRAPVLLVGHFLFSAMYLNELICRLFPAEMPADSIFAAYEHSLQALGLLQQHNSQLPAIEPVLRQFEFAALAELGLTIDWQLDGLGEPIAAGVLYQWQAECGFVPATTGWRGADLIAIAQSDWQPASLHVAKQLCRFLLKPLLGQTPLLSRQLFQPQ